ncbi:hypothetical protein Pan97_24050 [Bremerella volcania]|uniref:Uncharacterized protein n=1 Tax=Bremerella volcania TaxID=2527984 RepID=A0A518C822_9BACT|nr:hypothetical protein [Bremerella volcania]QDU75375.1 hypothetical protein Pan97_24050 [Bremerella volcania]
MPRLKLLDGLLKNLKGEIPPNHRTYRPVHRAYELLKFHTGQDFGDDYEKWEQWIQAKDESTELREEDFARFEKLMGPIEVMDDDSE